MSTDTISKAHRFLPVWTVAERTYEYLWENRELFALPILLLFVANFAMTAILTPVSSGGLLVVDPGVRPSFDLVFLLLGIDLGAILISMAIVVGMHRTIILDEAKDGFAFLRFDANLARFVWTAFQWVLLMLAISVAAATLIALLHNNVERIGTMTIILENPNQGLISLVIVATAIVMIIAMLRLLLIFPAAAVGGDAGRFTLSWRATRGNTALLFAAILLTQMPFILLDIMLRLDHLTAVWSAVSAHRPPPAFHTDLMTIALQAAVRAVAIAVFATTLSFSYDVIVRGDSLTVSHRR